jgi:hypothetical protein
MTTTKFEVGDEIWPGQVSNKQDDSGTVITYLAASIYKSAEMVKQAVVEWLNNNDI